MCVAAIAKIGPKAVKSPGALREELSFFFATSVGVPELGAEEKSTIGLNTARVDNCGVLRWT